jgi:PAS domain-containing protein
MKASKSRTLTLAGFGAAVIAITMMLGVFAYTRLQTIEGTARSLTTDYLPSIYLIGELRDTILLRYTLLTDRVTTDDEVEKSALDHEIDAARGEVDDVMNQYEKLIDEPEDRQLFDGLKSARNDYAKCFQQVLNLSREGHREEARSLITKRLIPLRNAVLRAAAAEVVWNKADADAGADRIMVALNWTSAGMVFCLAFSVGVVVIAHDIRQRLKIEEKLRQTEDRFRSMFEYASLGILVCSEGGRIVKANEAFCRMLGYSEEELLVKSWMDLTHRDDLDIALQNKKRLWSELGGVRGSRSSLHSPKWNRGLESGEGFFDTNRRRRASIFCRPGRRHQRAQAEGRGAARE